MLACLQTLALYSDGAVPTARCELSSRTHAPPRRLCTMFRALGRLTPLARRAALGGVTAASAAAAFTYQAECEKIMKLKDESTYANLGRTNLSCCSAPHTFVHRAGAGPSWTSRSSSASSRSTSPARSWRSTCGSAATTSCAARPRPWTRPRAARRTCRSGTTMARRPTRRRAPTPRSSSTLAPSTRTRSARARLALRRTSSCCATATSPTPTRRSASAPRSRRTAASTATVRWYGARAPDPQAGP